MRQLLARMTASRGGLRRTRPLTASSHAATAKLSSKRRSGYDPNAGPGTTQTPLRLARLHCRSQCACSPCGRQVPPTTPCPPGPGPSRTRVAYALSPESATPPICLVPPGPSLHPGRSYVWSHGSRLRPDDVLGPPGALVAEFTSHISV